jgi:hypothetical protein
LVVTAVVPLVGGWVDESMVGAEIDDLHRRGQLCCKRAARTVRERKEHDIGPGQGSGSCLGEGQVGDGPEVGVDLADGLPSTGLGCQRRYLEVGMARDEAQQFAAGVPAGAGYRDSSSHVHDYAS